MTLPSLFGLVGFFLAAVLHGMLLSSVRKRPMRGGLERLLTLLLSGLIVWYSGLFLASILRHMDPERVGLVLMLADALSFSALSFLPALLLHTHWAYYVRHFKPSDRERALVQGTLFLLYAGLLLLPVAIGQLFTEVSVNPLEKLGPFRVPFLSLLGLSYVASAALQGRIVQRSSRTVERTLFRQLIVLFLSVPVYTLWVFEFADSGQPWYPIQVNLALLGSVFPSLLVTYYVYRHQFLEFSFSRGFSNALLIVVIMTLYLAGIRSFGNYLESELKTPPILLEGIFLVGLLLIFPPLSQWLTARLSRSFSEEIAKFRNVARMIRAGSFQSYSTPELVAEIEALMRREFPEIDARIVFARDEPLPEITAIPLSRDKQVGYLQLLRPDNVTTGQREGLRVLAQEIANSLERSRLLQVQLALEREVAQKSRLEELGRMAATVAHNVKNPLSSIRTLLQLQSESANLTKVQREELGMMIEEVDRLARTVTSLLRFSRLGEGDQGTGPVLVNVETLLRSLATVYRGTAESGSLRLTTFCRLDPPFLFTDQESLQEVLSNLLSNAVEASPPGGEIVLGVGGSGDRAEFTVQDEGPGIPERLRERVFDPFYTTKSAGSGLGLAIVRRRVEQLGGQVRIDPGVPVGTRVIVEIPAAPAAGELVAEVGQHAESS